MTIKSEYYTRLSDENCNYMVGSNECFRLCRGVGVRGMLSSLIVKRARIYQELIG